MLEILLYGVIYIAIIAVIGFLVWLDELGPVRRPGERFPW
jgi:nitrate reductase NapE component